MSDDISTPVEATAHKILGHINPSTALRYSTPVTEVDEPTEAPSVTNRELWQHAKVVQVMVSVGIDDRDRDIETFEEAVRTALLSNGVDAKNVTLAGSYYILNGKVCLTADYDSATQDSRPGTYPPVWAGGPSEQEKKSLTKQTALDDETEDSTTEFVRVAPTKSNERLPNGRRRRSDHGVPRGPKGPKIDNIDSLKEAAANLAAAMVKGN
jgi:hypothetical protein